jgi:hypothetical protein
MYWLHCYNNSDTFLGLCVGEFVGACVATDSTFIMNPALRNLNYLASRSEAFNARSFKLALA